MLLASKEGRDAAEALAEFSGLGCSLAAGVAVFSWFGYQLDAWLGTEPAGLIGMCLLGSALSLYKVIRDVTRRSDEDDRRAKAE